MLFKVVFIVVFFMFLILLWKVVIGWEKNVLIDFFCEILKKKIIIEYYGN